MHYQHAHGVKGVMIPSGWKEDMFWKGHSEEVTLQGCGGWRVVCQEHGRLCKHEDISGRGGGDNEIGKCLAF